MARPFDSSHRSSGLPFPAASTVVPAGNRPLSRTAVMEHEGMTIFASRTEPKQQITLNGDATDGIPLPPGFAVDVGFPENVTQIHDRAQAEGVTIIEKLEDKPIGIRRFSMLDPNGTRVTIVAHLNEKDQPPR